MRTSKNHHPLTSQVTLSVILLVALSLTLVVVFGAYAVISVDQDSVERQKAFVQTGIAEQLDGLVREQQSVTVWDDSVVNVKSDNQQWMSENLGEWMYTYYGHDRVFVLNDKDQAVHAMRDGKTVAAPDAFAVDAPAVMALVTKLREILATNAASGGDSAIPTVVHDVVLLEGIPALASVQPITPDSNRVTQTPGTEYLDVSVQLIDKDLVGKIAKHYQLDDAFFTWRSPQGSANVALNNAQGITIGYLAWQADQPGLAMIRRIAPALISGAVLAGTVLVLLLRRLRRASKQLQKSQDEAQYLAFHDTLTGLPNRALFEDRLSRALATVRRGRGQMALICIDLDRFKQVNDTLGHQAGDELVRQTAQRLNNAVREVDTAARVGGDEFAIILVDIRDLRTAADLCDRLLEDLREPFEIMGEQVFIGASIGIAISPELGTDPEELLRKADIALYEAKRSGRGRSQVFAGDMDDFLKHRLLIERELRAALSGDDAVRLNYQPVFSIDGTTLAGVEATLAWDHAVHGALPASQLIAIAEDRGLIAPLTEKMLTKACQHAAIDGLPWISVGVSPIFLRHDSAIVTVVAILARTGLPAERLQLAIGESVLMEADSTAMSTIASLRLAGVRITLDDFGTGPSSLTALRRRPVDKLKIDGSFVRLLGQSRVEVAMVKALTDLAIALGMQMAADGVETTAQQALLAELGCEEVQGPLFARMAIAAAPTMDFNADFEIQAARG